MNDYPTSEMPAAYYYYDVNAAARNLEARVSGLPQARRSPMVRGGVGGGDGNDTASNSFGNSSKGKEADEEENNDNVDTSSPSFGSTDNSSSQPNERPLEEFLREITNDPHILFMEAVQGGHDSLVQILSEGKDADFFNYIENSSGNTALMLAAEKGHINIVQHLLAADGINATAQNNQGETALSLAVQNRHEQIAELLRKSLETTEVKNIDDLEPGFSRLSISKPAIGTQILERLSQAAEQDNNADIEIIKGLLRNNSIDVNGNIDGKGTTLLMWAANNGRIETLKFLIDRYPNINVNVVNSLGHTALTLAAKGGHVEVVEELLNASIDFNVSTDVPIRVAPSKGTIPRPILRSALPKSAVVHDKTTLPRPSFLYPFRFYVAGAKLQGVKAFRAAVQGGYTEVVKLLLSNPGISINDESKKDEIDKAFQTAARNGHIELVRFLINNPNIDINVNADDGLGYTALILAAHEGHAKVVEELLNASSMGINDSISIPIYGGRSENTDNLFSYIYSSQGARALRAAAQNGHVEVVRLLLSNPGTDVDDAEEGETALTLAAQNDHIEVVRALLGKGSGINITLKDQGKTALLHAANNRHVELLRELINDPAIIQNWKSKQAIFEALMNAAIEGHIEVIQVLRTTGVDFNRIDQGGNTVLIYAAANGHIELVEWLLNNIRGIDINLKTNSGETALICAAKYGYADVVKFLLKAAGMNLRAANKQVETALRSAAQAGYTDVVKVLLNPQNVMYYYWTKEILGNALSNAARASHVETVQALLDVKTITADSVASNLRAAAGSGCIEVLRVLLRDSRVDINSIDNHNGTALMCAAKNGHVKVVEELIADARLEIDSGSKYKDTALNVAARNGQVAVVEALLRVPNIGVNIQNNSGETALMQAVRKGNLEIVQLLLANRHIGVNRVNERGETALAIVKSKQFESQNDAEIIDLLIKKGAR